MKKTEDQNAGYEFAAILLSFIPTFLILLVIAVLYYLNEAKKFPLSMVLFFTSAFVASITHAIMGLEVNRKVKRIDLLQDGAGLQVIKTYYKEIGKHQKFPIILALFILSIGISAGVIVHSYIEDADWVVGILFFVVILLLILLRYLTKKYKMEGQGE